LISIKDLLKIDFDPDFLMRFFTVAPVLLILLAGAGALWVYFFTLSLLPVGESLVETPGLSADVKVIRDAKGIPSIIGENEEDVAFVLGYVMAQDRLWQMDYFRRAGQGRLAEILGSDYLDGDHLMRTVRASMRAKEYPGTLAEHEKRWLEKFVQGINRYIAAHAKKLPVEFSFLDYRPEPFSTEDIMSICLAFAWDSSPAVRIDPIMTRILGRLGKDRAMELWPTDPAAFPGVVSSDLLGWEPKGLLFPSPDALNILGRVPGFRGGCLWSCGPERSRSGKPIVCSSVYQPLSAPGFWYRAHLVAGDFCLSGAFIPGVPAALVGNNRRLAWGSISSTVDDADLFIQKLDPETTQRYWRIDRWNKIEERNERYRVRGGSSVNRVARWTETGPMVSDLHNYAALSLRWTALDGLGLVPALLRMNRAANGEEVKSALKPLVAPCMDVAWADDQGHWGIQSAGRIPIRSTYSDGIVPQPAWTGVHDWLGHVPFDELPAVTDPPTGPAIATDNRPGGERYPYFVSCYWSDADKTSRIMQVLGDNQQWRRELFEKLQSDSFSPLARDLTPILLKTLDAQTKKTGIEEEAAKLLGSWDFQMTKGSPAAAAFGLWLQTLLRDLFRNPLGDPLYEEFVGSGPLGLRMVKKIFLQGEKEWLDGVSPEQTLTTSFQKAITRGKRLMGGDPGRWKWGGIHAVTFAHPLTLRSRFMEFLYEVGPVSVSGSADAINFAGGSSLHPFKVVEGVSLRQISDLTDPPQIFAASPMGISAHFFSTHYKDQMRAWEDGRSFYDPVQLADVGKNDLGAMFFRPSRVGRISMGE
jgi:penicillin G amidase